MTNKIIEVKDFSYRYPRTSKYVLKDINISIREGEFIGVVGPTGAGKTTLCLAMCGLIPKVLGGKIEGSILINGRDTQHTETEDLIYSSEEKKAFVGITFQDPEAQIVGMTVEEDIAFGPENLGIESEKIQARVSEVLALIRMEKFRESFPYKLSGGQKQRIGIGSTMALRPQAIILDEPTSELDPIGRSEVLSVIRGLKEHNVAVVIVEHNTEELIGFADRVIVLDEGQIILDDDINKVFKQVDLLRSVGVRPPDSVEFIEQLIQAGIVSDKLNTYNEELVIDYLVKNLKED